MQPAVRHCAHRARDSAQTHRKPGDVTAASEVYRLAIVASEPIDWLISALCDCSKDRVSHFRTATHIQEVERKPVRRGCAIAGVQKTVGK